MLENLNQASSIIHGEVRKKGFYDSPREIGTLLMLVVSELSEALEADRKNKHANLVEYNAIQSHCLKYQNEEPEVLNPDVVNKGLFEKYVKDTFEDEIADALIRLLDLCGYLCIDIEKHIQMKLSYNENCREYKHGKKY